MQAAHGAEWGDAQRGVTRPPGKPSGSLRRRPLAEGAETHAEPDDKNDSLGTIQSARRLHAFSMSDVPARGVLWKVTHREGGGHRPSTSGETRTPHPSSEYQSSTCAGNDLGLERDVHHEGGDS
jgi:hypothetical protein